VVQTVRLPASDGLNLCADWAGPPDGQIVLLLHGSGQTRHSWGRALDALSQVGFRTYSADLRGHGDSDRSRDGIYNIEVHHRDVRAVVAALPGAPILVGASLGGLASLLTCGEAPRPAVTALALVDIAARADATGVAKIRGFMSGTVGGFDSLEAARAAVQRYLPHRSPPKTSAGLLKNLRQRGDQRWYWHWDPAIVDTPLLEGQALVNFERRLEKAARAVDVPALIVRGGRSEIVNAAAARRLAAIMPNAQIVEIENARHMVAGDDNDPFLDALLGFVRRVSSQA
jgi:pimeloyl-ACP methyl ester carboxylesterase